MILNLRGTSGSGKSYLVHRLLASYKFEPIHETVKGKQKVVGYFSPELNLYVVGRYETDCGGCDTVRDMDTVEGYVRSYAGLPANVIFEGLIVTSVIGRWVKISADFPGQFIWAFMDTPIEKCIERVMQRNGGKSFKHDNLIQKYNTMMGHYERRLKDTSERVVWIDHTRAVESFSEQLVQLGDLARA